MVITFGEKYGSGGLWIAKGLAEKLGYKFCNEEVVIEAIKNSGIDMTKETYGYFEQTDDDKMSQKYIDDGAPDPAEKTYVSSDITPLSGYLNNLINTLVLDTPPLNWEMDKVQRKVLNGFADEDNVVIMGKNSDYYLQDRPNVFRIFVTDDLPTRIKRIEDRFHVDEPTVEKVIKKVDLRRSNYYHFFTGGELGDPENYDLLIKTSLLGVDGWIEGLYQLILAKKAMLEEA